MTLGCADPNGLSQAQVRCFCPSAMAREGQSHLRHGVRDRTGLGTMLQAGARRHAEPSPNNPCDRHHPANEPSCKENREAAEKIKALPWQCARQVGNLGWCPSTAPDAPPAPGHEGPTQDGEIRGGRGQWEGTLPTAPGTGIRNSWVLQVLGKSWGCSAKILQPRLRGVRSNGLSPALCLLGTMWRLAAR